MSNSESSGGISVGMVLAALFSWWKWHSFGWAVLHALFGWLYVIYYLITYGTPAPIMKILGQ